MPNTQHPTPNTQHPTVALTLGDASGVGPEVAIKAALSPAVRARCRPLLVGPRAAAEGIVERLRLPARLAVVTGTEGWEAAPGTVALLDAGDLRPEEITLGQLSARSARAGVDAVLRAVELAQSGAVEAVVTAPLNKEGIRLAGVPFPGHTEILASAAGAKSVAMLLVSGSLRVIHVTVHVGLRAAIDGITRERVLATIRIAREGLAQLGIETPRIAVAGLNPHAGEAGLFGREEIATIGPACEEARAAGWDVSGPLPPDTVFLRASRGEFDVVVAMYHDQGHIPIKLFGFDRGVNITLGLPFVRTSVDHGTAFDIAGQGVAREESMVEAVEVAVRMALHRRAR